MLQTIGVSLQMGTKKLFDDVNLKFTNGNCYGVIGANGAGIVLNVGRYENYVPLPHRRVLAVGEKKPLAALANSDLIAIVVMELGKILGIRQANAFFIAVHGGIRGQGSEKNRVTLQGCAFLHYLCIPFTLNFGKTVIIMVL